jgi:hypothetical protein
MKRILFSAAVVLIAVPATALALSFESVGNAPLARKPGWAEGVAEVVNLYSRVYAVWHGLAETPTFYYQGDAGTLNEAIGKLAAVKAEERRLILLPGRGKTHSFDGKPIDFDWRLDLPSGGQPVLTVYVNAEKSRSPLDRKKAEKWLRDLDSDSFETRETASRELGKLGIVAKQFLREALKRRPTLEVRRRIEALLAKYPGTDVGDLEVPASLTVVTANDLLQAHLKELSGGDGTMAMSSLVELAPYSDKIVPALVARLVKGKNEYTRRAAAYCLQNMGAEAKAALPALKAALSDPDVNVRTAFRSAIEQIEKAKIEPGWGKKLKKRLAILKDLDEWMKARGK